MPYINTNGSGYAWNHPQQQLLQQQYYQQQQQHAMHYGGYQNHSGMYPDANRWYAQQQAAAAAGSTPQLNLVPPPGLIASHYSYPYPVYGNVNLPSPSIQQPLHPPGLIQSTQYASTAPTAGLSPHGHGNPDGGLNANRSPNHALSPLPTSPMSKSNASLSPAHSPSKPYGAGFGGPNGNGAGVGLGISGQGVHPRSPPGLAKPLNLNMNVNANYGAGSVTSPVTPIGQVHYTTTNGQPMVYHPNQSGYHPHPPPPPPHLAYGHPPPPSNGHFNHFHPPPHHLPHYPPGHHAHQNQPKPANQWPILHANGNIPNGGASSSPSSTANTEIHDFWKSRLAPLPGFVSRPDLMPTRGMAQPQTQNRGVAIKKPAGHVLALGKPTGGAVGGSTGNVVQKWAKGKVEEPKTKGKEAVKVKEKVKVKVNDISEKENQPGDLVTFSSTAKAKMMMQEKKLLIPPMSFMVAMSEVDDAGTGGPPSGGEERGGTPSPVARGPEEAIPVLSPISEVDEEDMELETDEEAENEVVDGEHGNDEVDGAERDCEPVVHEDTILDVYADPFIPQWLKDVQSQPHTLAPVPPIPVFPSVAYLQNYLAQRMVEDAMKRIMSLALISAPPPPPPKRPSWNSSSASFSPVSPANDHSSTSVASTNGNTAIPPLAVSTYHQHFVHLLRWELDALAKVKEIVVLWKVGIEVLDWKEGVFVLSAPNVRGDTDFGGKVGVGDLVHLREVIEEKIVGAVEGVTGRGTGRAFEARVTIVRRREGIVRISSPTLKQFIANYAPFDGSKRDESGMATFGPQDQLPYLFNVTFMLNSRPFCVMEHAVAAISKLLNFEPVGGGAAGGDQSGGGGGGGGGGPSYAQMAKKAGAVPSKSPVLPVPAVQTSAEPVGINLIQHWLFPEEEQLIKCPPYQIGEGCIKEEEWQDQGLNEEQQSAVTSIAMFQSPVPHLISGPPGTGKTRTVVETVLQILRTQPQACVLLCAPSNPATDTLVQRLKIHLLPKDMFRLNDQNRTFAEVPKEIMQYCYMENDRFALPPWKTLLKYRVVVTSCLDASILAAAQLTNVSLMAMEDEMINSIHPRRNTVTKVVVEPHWTHLLIDEAAQGSEPELLIPISVVVPHAQHVGKSAFVPQLVLCGDTNQLGPIVTSEDARAGELDVSLLERLFERRLYAQFGTLGESGGGQLLYPASASSASVSPLASAAGTLAPPGLEVAVGYGSWKGIVAYVGGGGGGAGGVCKIKPFTNLVKNYRSHPVILMPPSAMFYNDTLEPCASNGDVTWSGLPVARLPLKFIGHESPEATNDERATWYNKGEIRKIVDAIKSMLADKLLCNPPLRPADIGVMAPWREQVWKLREQLRKEGLYAVDVGTVEDFQGRESRVVIVSCVRSNVRFVEEDGRRGMGLFLERKRMNVAITRAKELLIVVGNGALLQRDPYWKSFLQFTIRNKLYVGPDLNLESDGNYISRLESRFFHSGAGEGGVGGSGDAEVDAEEEGIRVAGGVAREVLRE